MVTIGQQFKYARNDRGLTIEDVAFHTRIPAARIRDMENDDLSRFANLTYARGFLKIYGAFLEVDIADYLGQFHTEEFAHASGHEYVQTASATQNLPAGVITDSGRSRNWGGYVLLGLAAAVVGVVLWLNRGGSEEGHTVAQQVPPDTAKIPVAASAAPAPTPASPAEPVPVVAASQAAPPSAPAEVPAPELANPKEVAVSDRVPSLAAPAPDNQPPAPPTGPAPKAKIIEEPEP